MLLAVWQIAVDRHPGLLLPGPIGVAYGIADLVQHGLLLKYIVASLFRVTWGFGLAAIVAIPLGLTLGWYRRGEMAFLIQRAGMFEPGLRQVLALRIFLFECLEGF